MTNPCPINDRPHDMNAIDPAPVTSDRRLEEAYEILAGGTISVLSLDVFDTALWRCVPEPTDAFVLLGNELTEAGLLGGSVDTHLFAQLRVAAEARSRSLVEDGGDAPEVSLEAIYGSFPRHLLARDVPVDELVRLELDLERRITAVDPDVVELARRAQRDGLILAFVSDTYLSGAQLSRLITSHAPDLSPKVVLTSSDHGRGKAYGLFDVLLDDVGVEANRVLHIGDNHVSDVLRPTERGLRCVHFERVPAELQDVMMRERSVREGHPLGADRFLHPSLGDLGLTALRAKTANRETHIPLANPAAAFAEVGATVLGPIFTGFAQWVIEQASEAGFDTVFCAMREGEFLARLINTVAVAQSSPVRAETVWVSRNVCGRAAVVDGSRAELVSLLGRRTPPTASEFCRELGVDISELTEVRDQAAGRLNDERLRDAVLDAILGRPALVAAIVADARERRERLHAHVRSVVGAERSRWCLVDLGWGATIQRHLSRALAAAGDPVEIQGLYLATSPAVLGPLTEGIRARGFLGEAGGPERALLWIFRSVEILEQVCMCERGSLVGFTPDVQPVLGPVSEPPVQRLARVAVQRGIISFAEQWCAAADLGPEGRSRLPEARSLLLAALFRFLAAPTRREAEMFGGWEHDANQGQTSSELVTGGLGLERVADFSARNLLEVPMTQLYWPFGLASLAGTEVAADLTEFVTGTTPEVAAPAGAVPVIVLVDSGHGLEENTRVESFPGRSGGRAVHVDFDARPVRALSVMFGYTPAVVRLDWLALRFHVAGRSEPVELTWDAEGADQLAWSGHQVSPGVRVDTETAPSFAFACPPEWGEVYRVEIELGWVWMELR